MKLLKNLPLEHDLVEQRCKGFLLNRLPGLD